VVVKVLISADGRAQQAEVLTSSGYPRLDQAALASVRAARFRPAQRGNTVQEAWYQVPVRFELPR
jgi:protein TonB